MRLGAARSGRTLEIRFSASLVVVGVGLLIAGGVPSKLLLIYIAIGVSALALLLLILGAILHRAELFGREPEGIAAGQAGHDGYADEVAARAERRPRPPPRPRPPLLRAPNAGPPAPPAPGLRVPRPRAPGPPATPAA